jgi:hypothetical protein
MPVGYHRVLSVHSFQELISTPFRNGINALCWERTLPGDFREVVGKLATQEGILSLDEPLLRSLDLSAAGSAAVESMLADQALLRGHGLEPVLDCIHAYPRDEQAGAVVTDVYSFHADSAPAETDTYLCTYHGRSSEGLPNEHALRRVDIPSTRAALLAECGGQDDESFAEFLAECCYDLHYAPAEGAALYSFGLGNLWRIAVEYPGCPVPPCVHRAPETAPGDAPRLLMIS